MNDGLWVFLLASLGVIGLTYGASRLVGQWQAIQFRGRRLRVLEGVPLGRDRSILLVAVGKEVLVVGASSAGISLVHQVTDAEAAASLLAPQAEVAAAASPRPLPAEEAIRTSIERMRSLLVKAGVKRDA